MPYPNTQCARESYISNIKGGSIELQEFLTTKPGQTWLSKMHKPGLWASFLLYSGDFPKQAYWKGN